MPYFSVVIPSCNRKGMLLKAIDSVLSQDIRDFELIVVDDGSTDGTESIQSIYHGKLTYIYQPNAGVSSARNKGIAAASSPHIALLDSDDTWQSSKLRKDREYMDANPSVQIHQSEEIWLRNGKRVNQGNRYLKSEGDIFSQSLRLCAISPSSAVFSQEIIKKYGLFDESMQACEDYDLWLRITPYEYTGLIREKLITRNSGHGDQLSAEIPLLDRFRLYSIMKLLESENGTLREEQKKEAENVAFEKARILHTGSIKRGNSFNTSILDDIITSLESGSYTRKDYQNLLLLRPHP